MEELAEAGWLVALTYRSSAAAAAKLQESLAARGHETLTLQLELDDEAQRAAAVGATVAHFGRLDALVNNAAVFPRTPLETLTAATLRSTLATNLEGPLLLALASAPHLRQTGGSIVSIADVWGLQPLRHHLAYSVAKAGLIAATRGLAIELAPEVRVNAVAPGVALFPESYGDAKRQRILGRTLLHREGGVGEVARAVRYLVEDTHTMTGQVLAFDGGAPGAPASA